MVGRCINEILRLNKVLLYFSVVWNRGTLLCTDGHRYSSKDNHWNEHRLLHLEALSHTVAKPANFDVLKFQIQDKVYYAMNFCVTSETNTEKSGSGRFSLLLLSPCSVAEPTYPVLISCMTIRMLWRSMSEAKVQVSNIFCSPLAYRSSLLITEVLRPVGHYLLLVNPCWLIPVISFSYRVWK